MPRARRSASRAIGHGGSTVPVRQRDGRRTNVKITFVVPFINLTGGIRVLLDYANWLHDAGHEVTVVYPCWPYRFQYTRQQQWTEFKKHRSNDGRVPWFDLRCRLLRAPLIRSMFLPKGD